LGAFKPALGLAKSHELFFFLADFHALNHSPNPSELREHSISLAATMMALGLDTKNSVFYAQSMVPEVAELTWYLSCIAPYGMMARAHSFKDAQAKNKEINTGVFCYPILMAADILLYDADAVPVGRDQKQHLEYARDLAMRMNNRKEGLFTVPEPIIGDAVGIIPGVDGEKMSSSTGNVISIFATAKQWKKQVMSIVTDSLGVSDAKDPEACNVFKIYKLLATETQTTALAEKYLAGGFGYGHAKLELLSLVQETFTAASDRYHELMANPEQVRAALVEGSTTARTLAREKLEQVRSSLGLFK
jgi:tryptophanyl-tRNA synthetase